MRDGAGVNGTSDVKSAGFSARNDLLDVTLLDAHFAETVQLVAETCKMPISVISLLEGDQQCIRAESGLDHSQMSSAQSICALAIDAGGLLEIQDTAKDVRTAKLPMVVVDPRILFFAGVPLKTPAGVSLGSLCLLDTKPNVLDENQKFILCTLARQVTTNLHLRRALKERNDSETLNETILSSAVDYAIVTMDMRGNVTGWKGGAEQIMGWTEEEMIGRRAHIFFTEQDTIDGIPEKEMGSALLNGRGQDERWHIDKNGNRFWANGEMMPLLDANGTPQGFVKILRDRTKQRLDAEALVESEARWRGLFSSLREGFFLGEIIRDDTGLPVDFRFIEINAAFAEQSGLSVSSAGKTMREVVPDIPDWLIDNYARTVDTGIPQLFEIHVPALKRWFEVRSHKDSGQRFSTLFLDITARKGAEQRRLALIRLGDQLRDLSNKSAIAAAAARIMGEVLDLSRAGYGSVDHELETVEVSQDWAAPGRTSLAGPHTFRSYGSYIDELKNGSTVLIEDVCSDVRTRSDAIALTQIGIGSLFNLPVMEQNRFVALFFATKAAAHAWTDDEILFLRNIADRTRAAIARVEAEEQQRLYNLELSHRMKNMLAMVHSIIIQSMRGATDIDTARKVLSDRVIALSKSHDLLLGGALASTTLQSLIEHSLELHGDKADRFNLSGPSIKIGAKAATALSLIIHELATNAVKYGALSVDAGHVSIRWGIVEEPLEPQIHIRWIEENGPPVVTPERVGFGSRLIDRGLAGNFHGRADLSFPETGVICAIVAPLSGLQTEDAPRPKT